MARKLTIEYPDNLPDILQESAEQFEQEAKMAMVVKLFEMGRISSGAAAKMVGMGRAAFLLQLERYGVSTMNIDEDELLSDIANA